MVSQHYAQTHGGDLSAITFMGIEKVTQPMSVGDHRRETWWIFNLGTRFPNGLNIFLLKQITLIKMFTHIT